MDWSLYRCGRIGHITFAPDEPHLREHMRGETGSAELWQCLRCGTYVPGEPHGTGPAADAPAIRRGKEIRGDLILKLFAIERAIRFVIFGAVAFGIWRFANSDSIAQAINKDIPIVRDFARELGFTLNHALLEKIQSLLHVSSSNLRLLAFGVTGLAIVSGIEAFALWQAKRWGEYFAMIVTSLGLPFEIYELTKAVTITKIILFVLNLLLVGYLIYSRRLLGARGGKEAYEARLRADSVLDEAEKAAAARRRARQDPAEPAPPAAAPAAGESARAPGSPEPDPLQCLGPTPRQCLGPDPRQDRPAWIRGPTGPTRVDPGIDRAGPRWRPPVARAGRLARPAIPSCREGNGQRMGGVSTNSGQAGLGSEQRRNLLVGLLDDASLFPPGNLPMPAAVSAHVSHESAWFSDLTGPFVCPDTKLADLGRALTTANTPWIDLALVVTGGADAVSTATDAVAADPRLRLRAIEVPAAKGADVARAIADVATALDNVPLAGAAGYIEYPLAAIADQDAAGPLLEIADQHGYRPKLRTGGVTADAFPGENTLAGCLAAIAGRRIQFKCTAGLHHAVRAPTRLAGSNSTASSTCCSRPARQPPERAPARSPRYSASATGAAIAAAVRALSADESAEIRWLFTSFGTCSINEPVADLVSLGLLSKP